MSSREKLILRSLATHNDSQPVQMRYYLTLYCLVSVFLLAQFLMSGSLVRIIIMHTGNISASIAIFYRKAGRELYISCGI